MTQEDYTTMIKVRNMVYRNLYLIEKAIEKIKSEYDKERQISLLNMMIQLLLFVAETEEGRKMFFAVLDYAKDIDPVFSNKYWRLYDEEIETILENGYFTVTRS